jgi:hypothetical protein
VIHAGQMHSGDPRSVPCEGDADGVLVQVHRGDAARDVRRSSRLRDAFGSTERAAADRRTNVRRQT